MNASFASTAHSSSSACGTTAATALSFAASPFSLAAARESLLPALSAAAADYQCVASAASGVLSAAATAERGRARSATAAELLSATASNATLNVELVPPREKESNHATESAPERPPRQQKQQHVKEQQLLKKEEAVVMVVESSSTSTFPYSSSQREGCSTTGSAESLRERKYSTSSFASSVGGERATAAGGKGVAPGARQCGGGSDCSTRSCASGFLLRTKETANSSDDETRFHSTNRIRRPHSSNRITGEGERNPVKTPCGTRTSSEGKENGVLEERSTDDGKSAEDFVRKLPLGERGGRRHAHRTNRSGRRDTGDENTRRRKDRGEPGKPQLQESKSQSISGVGAPVHKREGRTATARHIQKRHGREYREPSRATRGDFSAADEDLIPEDESIVAPAFLTSRCSTRRTLVADVTAPAATAAFCATSTVSAAAVAPAPLEQRGGVAAPAAAAERGWFAAVAETEGVDDNLSGANSNREAAVGDELAVAIGARQPNLGDCSSCSFSGKQLSAGGSAASGGGLGPAALPLAASWYVGKQQEPFYGPTFGLLSARSLVALPSARGGDSSVKRSNTAAAGEKARGICDRTSWRGSRWPEEEEEDEEGKEEEAGVAASKRKGIRRGMSATATAERPRGLITASVSTCGASDLRTAARLAALHVVGAAAAAADRTRDPCVGDSRGMGLPSGSTANETSSGGTWRAAASSRGGGGRTTLRGAGKGVEGTSSGSGGCRGTAEAGTTTGGRALYDGAATAGPGGEVNFRTADVDYRTAGKGGTAGGAGTRCVNNNSSGAYSSVVGCGSEMAAGGERGRPGGLLLCAASGGGGGGGGDVKTAGCVGTMRGNDFRYNSRNTGTVNMGRAATVMNRPTRVEAGRQRFLILDSPSDENLPAYIDEMKAFNVTHLVRTCEATYDDALVRQAGICTHEWIFPDGEPPPEEVIDEWLALCNSVAAQQRAAAIAVHCVAGLGRAPVLVAVALIEKGMDPMDAIMFIRERRKGAINRRQLQFLKSYRRRSHMQRCCIKGCSIM